MYLVRNEPIKSFAVGKMLRELTGHEEPSQATKNMLKWVGKELSETMIGSRRKQGDKMSVDQVLKSAERWYADNDRLVRSFTQKPTKRREGTLGDVPAKTMGKAESAQNTEPKPANRSKSAKVGKVTKPQKRQGVEPPSPKA